MPGYFLDTSVWVAWHFRRHPNRKPAVELLKGRTIDDPAWFSRATETSFLRLITTQSLCHAYNSPVLTNHQALATLARWRTIPRVRFLDTEPEGTRDLWLRLADAPAPAPKLWMDAYLAALAIGANLPFATFDTGFRRFTAAGLDLRLLAQ